MINNIDQIIEKVIKKQLNEITSRFIYHWTRPSTAWKIIKNNQFSLMSTLFKEAEANLVGASHKHLYYLSLTRNGKIGQGGYSNSKSPWIRFTLNGDILNSNFHIKALDYFGSGGKFYRVSGEMSEVNGVKKIYKPGGETESEDRLYSRNSIIDNAIKYIDHIDIYFPMDDIKESNINDLPYVYNLLLKASSICTLYKTIEDFNNKQNSIPSSDFFEWFTNNKFAFGYSFDSLEDGRLPVEFLATVSYIVNFPSGSLGDCLKTLKNYGLEKYSNRVAKELQKNFILNIDSTQFYNRKYIERLLDNNVNGILGNIILHNQAKYMDRQDLAKGYKILTDFLQKHKLKDLKELKQFILDSVSENQGCYDLKYPKDDSYVMPITCVKIGGETSDQFFICLEPTKQRYKDVIPNGQDYLIDLYEDIKYYINLSRFNHKSKNNQLFLNYTKRLLNNPTVNEVITFYQKIEQLGNDFIDEYYRPHIETKNINRWQCQSLTYKSDYDHVEWLPDGSRIVMHDKSQIPQLVELWNNNVDSGLS